jgi:hypothetical protein
MDLFHAVPHPSSTLVIYYGIFYRIISKTIDKNVITVQGILKSVTIFAMV